MSKYYVLGDTEDHLIYEVDIFEWSCFVADLQDTQVDRTELGGFIVSTLFIGRGDMWGDRATEWFETTVYRNSIKLDEYTRPHRTWDRAEMDHSLVVAELSHLIAVAELEGTP